ncbi:MAG: Glycogen synthase [Parcubacteria group bacterium GW2011_GWE2_39_37]|uniref:Glycogen synthase n=1 Tax=Candidatus Falkowbacteria bacterium GW2011_GWF2_39_8 TaxID=1618642 RepID=A0A0G0T7H1_9BACT|nr:MAG: Glycogen synthase [Parcubacteria group bacterium GW2011_GWE2_39_37]KKR33792.1 MAG: Glycogen synthase [Candidatus Falkowbacteria bacterium GW2011_GWF2_39_8]
MTKKLKIVSVASEVAPFSKTGGLADVARSLPKAIKRLGHEVMVITPFYGKVIDKEEYDLKLIYKEIKISLNAKEDVVVNYWQGYLMKDLPIYFVENKKYFSQKKSIYGSTHENTRFLIFDVAVLKLLSILKFEADIIHCHDWQTGLIPFYLKNDFKYSKSLSKTKTVYTIHNLVFQFGRNWWEVPADKKDFGKRNLPLLADSNIEYINFAKRGILSADVINTVSEQYREEIMTKSFGQDLDRILRNRKDRLFGIINGIDYKAFNPLVDIGLFKNYDYKKIHRKKLNKEYLQETFKLPIDRDVPIISLTSRVTFQKGFELIIPLLDHLLSLDLQIIILGDGDKKYINELKKFQKKYSKKIVWLPFTGYEHLETMVYAGSDFILLPSHHEPCGINQLKAMRYGCIPIVRRVGGLYDTVKNFNPATNQGTGFTFNHFDVFSLHEAMVRALETFKYKKTFREMMVRAMQQSNSWEIPAKKYVTLYRKAVKLPKYKIGNGNNKGNHAKD